MVLCGIFLLRFWFTLIWFRFCLFVFCLWLRFRFFGTLSDTVSYSDSFSDSVWDSDIVSASYSLFCVFGIKTLVLLRIQVLIHYYVSIKNSVCFLNQSDSLSNSVLHSKYNLEDWDSYSIIRVILLFIFSLDFCLRYSFSVWVSVSDSLTDSVSMSEYDSVLNWDFLIRFVTLIYFLIQY